MAPLYFADGGLQIRYCPWRSLVLEEGVRLATEGQPLGVVALRSQNLSTILDHDASE